MENNKGRFQIKIFFGDNNIRRYSFDKSPTWNGFFDSFKQLFRVEYNPQRRYVFYYFDPENDRIVLDSESEWQEMLHLFKGTSILKIHVKEEVVNRKVIEDEEKVKKEAEEKVKKEAEEKARKEAEEKAKKEAEEKARKEAEEKAKKEAEEKARKEAEEKTKKEAEVKARKDAQEKARKEAEEKKKLAEEKAKKLAEEKARKEAEEKARKEAEEKALKEAEEKALKEAEEKVKKEAEEKACKEAEEKRKAEADKNSATVQKYSPQLRQLNELGFVDVNRNLKLLVTFNGKMEDVINTLLST